MAPNRREEVHVIVEAECHIFHNGSVKAGPTLMGTCPISMVPGSFRDLAD